MADTIFSSYCEGNLESSSSVYEYCQLDYVELKRMEEKVLKQNLEIFKLKEMLEKEKSKNESLSPHDLLNFERKEAIEKMEKSGQGQVTGIDSLMLKIQRMLECPVCLDVPRSGPVFNCPNGHLICASCRQSQSACPTCKFGMGYTKSRLATELIEIILHDCRIKGCSVKITLDQLAEHETECNFRNVRCPSCQEELPLSKLLPHSLHECSKVLKRKSTSVYITWDKYQTSKYVHRNHSPNGSWKTHLYVGNEANCILKVTKNYHFIKIEVVMLGKSDKYIADIIVHHNNSVPNKELTPSFKYVGKPCSIDMKQEDRICYGLVFCAKAIPTMFPDTEEGFAVSLKLKKDSKEK